jgi:hypothetical protein
VENQHPERDSSGQRRCEDHDKKHGRIRYKEKCSFRCTVNKCSKTNQRLLRDTSGPLAPNEKSTQ